MPPVRTNDDPAPADPHKANSLLKPATRCFPPTPPLPTVAVLGGVYLSIHHRLCLFWFPRLAVTFACQRATPAFRPSVAHPPAARFPLQRPSSILFALVCAALCTTLNSYQLDNITNPLLLLEPFTPAPHQPSNESARDIHWLCDSSLRRTALYACVSADQQRIVIGKRKSAGNAGCTEVKKKENGQKYVSLFPHSSSTSFVPSPAVSPSSLLISLRFNPAQTWTHPPTCRFRPSLHTPPPLVHHPFHLPSPSFDRKPSSTLPAAPHSLVPAPHWHSIPRRVLVEDHTPLPISPTSSMISPLRTMTMHYVDTSSPHNETFPSHSLA
ncbi:hypothetical protein R3P38DRAFT_3231083 [Favolaschia claudopus]|uniref:Uncharacterized protein n=1 Tax=Favolaschia claudopus TaxID=2862362 RepID=A0AAV9ZLL0_9AGAR